MLPLTRSRWNQACKLGSVLLGLLMASVLPVDGQAIGDFISLEPGPQNSDLHLPGTHTFQRIIEHNDALTTGGVIPDNFDFTGYVPIGGSSALGYLSINSERTPGAVSVLDIFLDTMYNKWRITYSSAIDFSPVVTTARNCSGGITPWGTVISCEEAIDTNDANNDGHYDIGWSIEIDPVNKVVIDKLWELGNFAHENAVVHANMRTVYQGADSDPGYLYKFVADSVTDLSSGVLYVYAGPKEGNGDWIQLDNDTPAERNHTLIQSDDVGATVFSGIEDCEIGPDGKIYFAVKGENRIYRFDDPDPISGTTVTNMETYAGGTDYTVDYGMGTATVACCAGADNLAFDGEDNLWLLQDGGNDYIWVFDSAHSQAVPDVRIFGRTPAGSEPTGITFSPDHKYLFMSIQHPNSSNDSTNQQDAHGVDVDFSNDIAIVIAREGDLGLPGGCPPAGTACDDGDATTIDDQEDGFCNCTGTAYSGSADIQIGTGNDDVEQNGNDGSIYENSTDIEIVNDGTRGDQIIGLRFQGVNIPQGSFINHAYIQFTVDETDSGTNFVEVVGEDTDDAAPFALVVNNVSNRASTEALRDWSIPAWSSVGAKGYDQRTPELRLVAKEIIGRGDWTPGNDMVFMISGSGSKTAESYEGSPADAAVLHIEWDSVCTIDHIMYVDESASGKETGDSWPDAISDLNEALFLAAQCPDITEIWVRTGTYHPTASTDRTASFELTDGISIYGGFDGTESMRNQRDPMTHVTVLSGDIGIPMVHSDNSYHILTYSGLDSAIVDGFALFGGNANGAAPVDDRGGGVYTNNGTLVLNGLIFINCSATTGANAVYTSGAGSTCVMESVGINSLNTGIPDVMQANGAQLVLKGTNIISND